MDRRNQHRQNACKERRWIADAARDKRNLMQSGHRLWKQGHRIEARFDFQEAAHAQSWENKRKRILKREVRLSR